MSLRWRPMKPKDVAGCAEIIAAHPVIGPRYGPLVKDLGRAWLRLLDSQAMTTAVFEEVEKGRVTLAGVGVGVFVHDEFVRELKTRPQFWFGPELVKRALDGNSPVLSDQEVRAANSGDGLNELVWETLPRQSFAQRTELYHLMGGAYIEIHRGFRLKEMITSQAESPQRLQWALDAGRAVLGSQNRALCEIAQEGRGGICPRSSYCRHHARIGIRPPRLLGRLFV